MSNVDVTGLKDAAKAFLGALTGKREADQARKDAQTVYSQACEAMASAIPGDKKKVRMTVDGESCELTFSKAGKGGGWSCRGLPGADAEESQEIIDLG
jgi:hypothetical protein